MTIKTVIFDIDGVLFNTDELYFKYLQQALAANGIRIDEEFYAKHGYDDCIYKLNLSNKQIQNVLTELHANYYSDDILKKVHMKEGACAVLEQLSDSMQIATGSGEEKSQIERYLRHFNIIDYFSFIGHSNLVEGRKRNPKYFHTIANYFGVSPQECLHIGDNLHDQYGLAAGVNVAIIPTSYSSHITFDPRCHMLESISDVPKLIGSLSSIKT